MKILIINPAPLDEKGVPLKYKKAYCPPLILAVLSSLTPRHHDVECINDIVEEIDFTKPYDLVALTSNTQQSGRVYQIADMFRNRGVKVVIGGIHATALPNEAKMHADAVVIGEADNLWESVLDDCERNALRDFYKDSSFPDLKKLVIPRWDTINMKYYPRRPGKKYPVLSLTASRGCPMGCSFCSVTKYFGKTYRSKPVENVLSELDAIEANDYFFIDDNVMFNPDYCRELFAGLARRDIHWMGMVSTRVLKNPDLIERAAQAGCYDVLLGMETINRDSLTGVNKTFNKIEEYEELIKRLMYSGIMPTISLIIGFDEDDVEQFRLTLDFLKRNKIFYAMFFVLTPLPGTDLYENLSKQGRMLHNNWSLYNGTNVVYKPKKFTPEELTEHYWKIFNEFYSMKNICIHLGNSLNIRKRRMSAFADNILFQLYYKSRVHSRIHPYSCFGSRTKEKPL